MEELKKYISENYKPENGAITSQWSAGNSDDVFDDGDRFGSCHLLYKIGTMIGMDLKKPHEQEYDY
jgi:hypothetical protein